MSLFKSASPSPRWLLLVAAVLLLWQLDYAPVWNPDEARYATSALEMVQPLNGGDPDWVVPHLNTVARLNKPPLVYWTAAISFHVFGPSAGAGRLVSALAAIGIMLIVWRLARSMFGEEAGLLSALVWATAVFSCSMARVLNTDMLLSFTMVLILWGIWQIIETKPRAPLLPFLITGIGIGLAMLAKGPVGVALPLLIALIYLCIARRWGVLREHWNRPGAVLAVLIAAAISVPWYLAVAERKPEFLVNFLWKENFGRFSGSEEYHKKSSPLFYVPVVLLGLWPWTPLLFRAAARLRVQGLFKAIAPDGADQATNADVSAQRDRLFLWLWAGFIVGFFSLSSTKLITYILPAFPALAMLVGEALSGLSHRQNAPILPEGSTPAANESRSSWWTAMPIVALVLNAVLIAACAIFLLNNKILPRGEALPFVIAGAVVLIAGSMALVWWWRRKEAWRLAVSQAAAAAALYLVLLGLAGRVAAYEDISPMMQALRPHLHSGDRVIQYRTFQPTAIFYLARPITIINYSNMSGLDEQELRGSPFYWPDDNAVHNFLAGAGRVFVVTRTRNLPHLVSTKVHVLGRNNDYALLSNRPAPSGFRYHCVAPRKKQALKKK